jgi:acyl transferase domain-containing protein
VRIPNIEQITRVTAGYGVGEINALVYSQMLSFEEALDYLHLRSQFLKKSAALLHETKSLLVNYTAGSNLAFLCRAAREWCTRKGVPEAQAICQITHKLGPQRCIIGGHSQAIEFLLLNRKEFALQSIKDVHFQLAMYSQCLRPVGDLLRESCPEFKGRHPRYQVVSAIDAELYNRLKLRKNLIQQIHRQVNFEGVLSRIYNRRDGTAFPQTYECAAQAHVKKLLFRCNRKATEMSKRILAC